MSRSRPVPHDDASFATKALISKGSVVLRVRSCAEPCRAIIACDQVTDLR